MAGLSGLQTRYRRVAELGPGNSWGTGLAAVLSGADEYVAVDVVRYASETTNLHVLDELVNLFVRRAGIPDVTEFPRATPLLPTYSFPNQILTPQVLEASLAPRRLDAVREALKSGESGDRSVRIKYLTCWDEASEADRGTLDLVFSQAVMEHVDEVDDTYRGLYQWLRPGGVMSHTIDFRSHGLTQDWNGHWTVPDPTWRFVRGKRPYLINRWSHSAHIRSMQRAGFRIASSMVVEEGLSLARENLAPRFRKLSDDDLRTCVAFIQAVKPVTSTL